MVGPTHLQNINNIGSTPQIGMNIKKQIWNHHLIIIWPATGKTGIFHTTNRFNFTRCLKHQRYCLMKFSQPIPWHPWDWCIYLQVYLSELMGHAGKYTGPMDAMAAMGHEKPQQKNHRYTSAQEFPSCELPFGQTFLGGSEICYGPSMVHGFSVSSPKKSQGGNETNYLFGSQKNDPQKQKLAT